jgi:transposase
VTVKTARNRDTGRPECADTVEEVGHSLPLGRPRDSVIPADCAGGTAMMGFQETPARLFYDFCLDEHVPTDHLLRGIDRHLDLADLRQSLKPFYSQMGRPSVDPELMIRMLIVGYSMGIRSERRLCEEVHLNLAYRWFCRLGLDGRVPDHSTFSA